MPLTLNQKRIGENPLKLFIIRSFCSSFFVFSSGAHRRRATWVHIAEEWVRDNTIYAGTFFLIVTRSLFYSSRVNDLIYGLKLFTISCNLISTFNVLIIYLLYAPLFAEYCRKSFSFIYTHVTNNEIDTIWHTKRKVLFNFFFLISHSLSYF